MYAAIAGAIDDAARRRLSHRPHADQHRGHLPGARAGRHEARRIRLCPAGICFRSPGELLAENPDAKLLAGGQSLLTLMNLRLARPAAVIDIGRLTELGRIFDDTDDLVLGSLVTHRTVETDPFIAARAPLLSDAARYIGHVGIRNRGTIGGSVAHADPPPRCHWPHSFWTPPSTSSRPLGPSAIVRRRHVRLVLHQRPCAPRADHLGFHACDPARSGLGFRRIRTTNMATTAWRAPVVTLSPDGRAARCVPGYSPLPIGRCCSSATMRWEPCPSEQLWDDLGEGWARRTEPAADDTDYARRLCIAAFCEADDRARGARTRTEGRPAIGLELAPPPAVTVSVTVNGRMIRRPVPPRLTLPTSCATNSASTGTHLGCETRDVWRLFGVHRGPFCAACLTLAVQVDGPRVDTVEGLDRFEEAARLRRAFSERGGLQCGFCTPGFLVTARWNCSGTRRREAVAATGPGGVVRQHLSVTGYQGIVAAVSMPPARRTVRIPDPPPPRGAGWRATELLRPVAAAGGDGGLAAVASGRFGVGGRSARRVWARRWRWVSCLTAVPSLSTTWRPAFATMGIAVPPCSPVRRCRPSAGHRWPRRRHDRRVGGGLAHRLGPTAPRSC